MIRYGNRHKLIPNVPKLKNGRTIKHEWVCYVELEQKRLVKAQDIFSKVKFILPQCYENRNREVRADNSEACRNSNSYFECKEVGWGTVNVQMELTFKEDLGLQPIRL